MKWKNKFQYLLGRQSNGLELDEMLEGAVLNAISIRILYTYFQNLLAELPGPRSGLGFVKSNHDYILNQQTHLIKLKRNINK